MEAGETGDREIGREARPSESILGSVKTKIACRALWDALKLRFC